MRSSMWDKAFYLWSDKIDLASKAEGSLLSLTALSYHILPRDFAKWAEVFSLFNGCVSVKGWLSIFQKVSRIQWWIPREFHSHFYSAIKV